MAVEKKIKDEFLVPEFRAQDILLGASGFGEDVTLISVERYNGGYRGVVRFSDGEESPFENDEEPNELESWALDILTTRKKATA